MPVCALVLCCDADGHDTVCFLSPGTLETSTLAISTEAIHGSSPMPSLEPENRCNVRARAVYPLISRTTYTQCKPSCPRSRCIKSNARNPRRALVRRGTRFRSDQRGVSVRIGGLGVTLGPCPSSQDTLARPPE